MNELHDADIAELIDVAAQVLRHHYAGAELVTHLNFFDDLGRFWEENFPIGRSIFELDGAVAMAYLDSLAKELPKEELGPRIRTFSTVWDCAIGAQLVDLNPWATIKVTRRRRRSRPRNKLDDPDLNEIFRSAAAEGGPRGIRDLLAVSLAAAWGATAGEIVTVRIRSVRLIGVDLWLGHRSPLWLPCSRVLPPTVWTSFLEDVTSRGRFALLPTSGSLWADPDPRKSAYAMSKSALSRTLQKHTKHLGVKITPADLHWWWRRTRKPRLQESVAV